MQVVMLVFLAALLRIRGWLLAGAQHRVYCDRWLWREATATKATESVLCNPLRTMPPLSPAGGMLVSIHNLYYAKS